MNFSQNQPVWLTDGTNRWPAVAVEAPGDHSVFTFAFRFDERLATKIGEHYDDQPFNLDSDGRMEGLVNEMESDDVWPGTFDSLPGDAKPCYSIMGTRDREDGAYVNEQGEWRYADTGLPPHPPDDFDCKWDGLSVEPRE
jgi:hypothetical protein